MKAYYNENDPFAVGWLRELIKAGLIADGEVDERSIEDVRPSDLRGFTQCHFFAGIGVWSYALRNAGWSDDTPVWTGSCPCQSFSAAGKGEGFSDKRHLWPSWFRLIGECRPHTIFGEQVASKDGLAWLDVVSADMEGADYAIGTADLCAAGFGAPHIRQRLFFVADASVSRPSRMQDARANSGDESARLWSSESERIGSTDIVVNASESRCEGNVASSLRREGNRRSTEQGGNGAIDGLPRGSGSQLRGPTNGFWRDAEWLYCRDGKFRPTKPGTPVLATGIANRVGKLRGFGNAINAEVAQGFIEAYMSIEATA